MILCGAFLVKTNLFNARLNGANLRGVLLDDADKSGTRLTSANLSDTQFSDRGASRPATGLT